MLKLVNIGSIYDDPVRTIVVSDGKTEETCSAKLVVDTDYRQEWNCFCFGQKHKMIAQLEYQPGTGTVLVFKIS